MFAYFSANLSNPVTAKEAPEFARILAAGPWQFRDLDHAGKRGVWAEWKSDRFTDQRDYGTPRQSPDGLWYFPSKEKPPQDKLAKPSVPTGIDVTLSTGVTLTIPLAAAAPRALTFGDDDGLGEPVSEFALLADRVFERLRDKKQTVTLRDAEIRRLLVLAIQQCYRVTDEVLSDLRWITTVDVEPILCAIAGSDPKALPDVSEPSPSPASGSPTSP